VAIVVEIRDSDAPPIFDGIDALSGSLIFEELSVYVVK